MTDRARFNAARDKVYQYNLKGLAHPPRDPERIDRVLDLLGKLWKKQPDQRLGQLLVNAKLPTDNESDLFNIEDDKTLVLLEALYQRWSGGE